MAPPDDLDNDGDGIRNDEAELHQVMSVMLGGRAPLQDALGRFRSVCWQGFSCRSLALAGWNRSCQGVTHSRAPGHELLAVMLAGISGRVRH